MTGRFIWSVIVTGTITRSMRERINPGKRETHQGEFLSCGQVSTRGHVDVIQRSLCQKSGTEDQSEGNEENDTAGERAGGVTHDLHLSTSDLDAHQIGIWVLDFNNML